MNEEKQSSGLAGVYEQLNGARIDIAELKGMIKMHLETGQHHYPPCKPATELQKTIMSALAAAVIALVTALANIIVILVKGG